MTKTFQTLGLRKCLEEGRNWGIAEKTEWVEKSDDKQNGDKKTKINGGRDGRENWETNAKKTQKARLLFEEIPGRFGRPSLIAGEESEYGTMVQNSLMY